MGEEVLKVRRPDEGAAEPGCAGDREGGKGSEWAEASTGGGRAAWTGLREDGMRPKRKRSSTEALQPVREQPEAKTGRSRHANCLEDEEKPTCARSKTSIEGSKRPQERGKKGKSTCERSSAKAKDPSLARLRRDDMEPGSRSPKADGLAPKLPAAEADADIPSHERLF